MQPHDTSQHVETIKEEQSTEARLAEMVFPEQTKPTSIPPLETPATAP